MHSELFPGKDSRFFLTSYPESHLEGSDMTHGETVIGNVCFIFDKTHKQVLLLKRAREPMKDLYTGVGGKTEFKESVHESCLREVQEETGLEISNVKLKAVVKTILKEKNSAWLLFVYTAEAASEKFIECNEGTLNWVSLDQIDSFPLIGFIQEIFPSVIHTQELLEGIIHHDLYGNVLAKELHLSALNKRTLRSSSQG